jgi:hypothetical protein
MRGPRIVPPLAVVAGGLSVVLLIVAAASGPILAPVPAEELYSLRILGWLGFVLVGMVIAFRRPRTVIAWLLIGAGASAGAGALGGSIAARVFLWGGGASSPNLGYVGVVLYHLDVTGLLLLGLALLRFPRDRWPSPRWRWVAWLLAVLAVVAPLSALVSPTIRVGVARPPFVVTNPLPVESLAGVAWALQGAGAVGIILTLTIVIDLVRRGYASTGSERRQMKWLAYTAGLVLFLFPILLALEVGGALPPLAEDIMVVAYFAFGLNAMAAAIGVAVLRYRLYEVDRIASRTATYVSLTLVLVGVYVGGVLGLGALFRPLLGDGGGDLVVAASTLAVAALFAPLRRRIRTLMDRRFNRSQVDAGQIVEEFGRQLRDEVDLEALSGELHLVVTRTVQPACASVWIRR